MQNGAEVIHLATGLVVGYPPCPRITQFKEFIEEKYKTKVVYGTHPIPQKYMDTHSELGTWKSAKWAKIIEPTLSDMETRLAYN